MTLARPLALIVLLVFPVMAQAPNDPFPAPIAATEGVIKVNFVEFASLPDLGGQQPSRPMLLVDEPGTRTDVRQRHARSAVYRQPRWQGGCAVP